MMSFWDKYILILSLMKDSGTECTLGKSVNDNKLSVAVDTLVGRNAIQRDPEGP